MSTSSRSEKIRSILEARRPMAARAEEADQILNKIENQLRLFKEFVPTYAKRLDSDAAASITSLLTETEEIIGKIGIEKVKIALLSGRYSRATLNIGVAGRARQGKSWFLQKLTGLTPDEIPSGAQGHCTGAPSVIINHDSETTYAEIAFHTSHSFLDNVVAPFFDRLDLGTPPASISQFRSATISLTANPNSKDPTTDVAFLEKLIFFQKNIGDYEQYLTGQTLHVSKEEIRAYIAQDDIEGERTDSDGKPYSKWVAVQLATVYCRFPHQDLGSIAVADTPGIGDFVCGSDDRLVSMIGKNLDSIIFLRMPEAIGALIKPEDTALHSVVTRSIPELPINAWSYFIINKNLSEKGNNLDQIPRFQDLLEKSPISTKKTLVVNCSDQTDVASSFDEILNDIAENLNFLDQSLFNRQKETLKALAISITAFAEKAASILPKAASVASDGALLNKLFGEVWKNIGFELQELVKTYRQIRDQPDESFLAAVKSVFKKLDEGPNLPSLEEISRISAGAGLQIWHGEKLHDLRVIISNSFDELNSCLDSSFEQLRDEALAAFTAESCGKLGRLERPEGTDPWDDLLVRWRGHSGEEVMCSTINKLRTASLSFRGFIQPRVRDCLDVLDGDSVAAKDFAFTPGDTPEIVKEKLEAAWENACFNCKSTIEEMAREPAMARFAAAEDFRDAVLRTGGAANAMALWHLFYGENRGEIWKEQFDMLEAGTRLRKEWENAVKTLKDAALSLAASA